MELETGARVFVLPENIVRVKLNNYKLKSIFVKLKAYDGTAMNQLVKWKS